MSKTKVELNHANIRAYLKNDSVTAMLESYGSRTLQRCGEGYEMDSRRGRNRTIVEVRTATPEAVNNNLKHNTLLKALGGAK